MPEEHDDIAKHGYNNFIGFLYVFNLVVGTGVLILPGTFESAGYLLATPVLLWLGFVAWVTTTFLIEALSITNKLKKDQKGEKADYSLDDRYEFSDMAIVILPLGWRRFTYVIMILYLGGDVAIYGSIAGKTLTNVFCGNPHSEADYMKPCKEGGMNIANVYRIAVTTFCIVIGSFSYFAVKKTLAIQIFTSVYRWLVLLTMIFYGLYHLSAYGPKGNPALFRIHRIPALIGATVYAFMCHHSLPSLLHPIRDKSRLPILLLVDYITIATFYLLLPYTAIFTFETIESVYTLNFIPEEGDSAGSQFMGYYVSIFPAVVLCSSFPIVCISLQRNMKSLVLDMDKFEEYNFFVRRLLFPTLALSFFIIAVFCRNVKLLVTLTGAYPGACVQYLLPVALVYYGRKTCNQNYGDTENPFRSYFKQNVWIYIVGVWTIFVFIFITYNTYFWFKEETIINN